jgi:ABC-type nitrate/sulfonate/bicarbonate transport system substrate-binding protein
MTRLITNASVLIFVVAVACETATAQSTTQTGRDQKYVIIGTTSKTVGYMGPWIGKIKGFFQAEGVRVDIPILRSATTGVQALVGGSTQFDATTVATENQDTVKRVLRGLIRSFRWLHQNREDAISLISSELRLERRYAEAGWEEYVRSNAWPQNGEVDVEGVRTQIQILAQINKPVGMMPAPEHYVNSNYLRAAQKELGM